MAFRRGGLGQSLRLRIQVDIKERGGYQQHILEAAASRIARHGPERTVLGVMAQQGGESGLPADSQQAATSPTTAVSYFQCPFFFFNVYILLCAVHMHCLKRTA